MTDAGGRAAEPTALERVGAPAIDAHLGRFFETWLDTFIFHGRVDPTLRELSILRIMWRTGQSFEWGNHYRLARAAGISDEQILSVRTTDPERDLDEPLAIVVRAADEVVDAGVIGERTMAALRDVFVERPLFDEFLYLLGGYRMFAMVSASRREVRDTGHRPWPPDGIGPPATASA